MQKHVNLVDLVKSFPTNIYLQNLASIQKRTSPVKFAHLAEKSGKGSISNFSTKVQSLVFSLRHRPPRRGPPERAPKRERRGGKSCVSGAEGENASPASIANLSRPTLGHIEANFSE